MDGCTTKVRGIILGKQKTKSRENNQKNAKHDSNVEGECKVCQQNNMMHKSKSATTKSKKEQHKHKNKRGQLNNTSTIVLENS